MNVPRRLAVLVAVMVFAGGLAMPARAGTSTIGILVYDGFLTSDVTAPVEVFGAASKKAWFSSYKVVTVSTTKQGVVHSEEGLTILADKTIYDPLSLDVLIVPSAYKMDGVLKNTDVINFIKQQGRSASWMASNCSGARLLSCQLDTNMHLWRITAHNAVHRCEVAEMLKAPPHDFRAGAVAPTAPHKPAELGDPGDGLA